MNTMARLINIAALIHDTDGAPTHKNKFIDTKQSSNNKAMNPCLLPEKNSQKNNIPYLEFKDELESAKHHEDNFIKISLNIKNKPNDTHDDNKENGNDYRNYDHSKTEIKDHKSFDIISHPNSTRKESIHSIISHMDDTHVMSSNNLQRNLTNEKIKYKKNDTQDLPKLDDKKITSDVSNNHIQVDAIKTIPIHLSKKSDANPVKIVMDTFHKNDLQFNELSKPLQFTSDKTDTIQPQIVRENQFTSMPQIKQVKTFSFEVSNTNIGDVTVHIKKTSNDYKMTFVCSNNSLTTALNKNISDLDTQLSAKGIIVSTYGIIGTDNGFMKNFGLYKTIKNNTFLKKSQNQKNV